jgi:hypothetical protein
MTKLSGFGSFGAKGVECSGERREQPPEPPASDFPFRDPGGLIAEKACH